MEINRFMASNLASLRSTLSLSVINMEKNMSTAQATQLVEDLSQIKTASPPPSKNIIDIKA